MGLNAQWTRWMDPQYLFQFPSGDLPVLQRPESQSYIPRLPCKQCSACGFHSTKFMHSSEVGREMRAIFTRDPPECSCSGGHSWRSAWRRLLQPPNNSLSLGFPVLNLFLLKVTAVVSVSCLQTLIDITERRVGPSWRKIQRKAQ